MTAFSSSILFFGLSDKFASSYDAKDLEFFNIKLNGDQIKYKHAVRRVSNIGNDTANQIIIPTSFLG